MTMLTLEKFSRARHGTRECVHCGSSLSNEAICLVLRLSRTLPYDQRYQFICINCVNTVVLGAPLPLLNEVKESRAKKLNQKNFDAIRDKMFKERSLYV